MTHITNVHGVSSLAYHCTVLCYPDPNPLTRSGLCLNPRQLFDHPLTRALFQAPPSAHSISSARADNQHRNARQLLGWLTPIFLLLPPPPAAAPPPPHAPPSIPPSPPSPPRGIQASWFFPTGPSGTCAVVQEQATAQLSCDHLIAKVTFADFGTAPSGGWMCPSLVRDWAALGTGHSPSPICSLNTMKHGNLQQHIACWRSHPQLAQSHFHTALSTVLPLPPTRCPHSRPHAKRMHIHPRPLPYPRTRTV